MEGNCFDVELVRAREEEEEGVEEEDEDENGDGRRGGFGRIIESGD